MYTSSHMYAVNGNRIHMQQEYYFFLVWLECQSYLHQTFDCHKNSSLFDSIYTVMIVPSVQPHSEATAENDRCWYGILWEVVQRWEGWLGHQAGAPEPLEGKGVSTGMP